MVLPLFDYCCVVWDGCGQGNKNYLDRLLKRAAGIIAGRKATDTDIQQTLKWPSLQCRREHQAPVVQKQDSAIHRINHYPVDKYSGNQLRYPLDRHLSAG